MTTLVGLILLILFWKFIRGDYQTSKTTSPKSVNTNNPSSSKFYSCNEVDIIVKHPESMEDGRVYDLSGNRIYKISKTMRDKSFKNKSYLGRKEFDSGTIRWVEINPDEIESELNKSEFIIQHSLEIKSKTTSKKKVSAAKPAFNQNTSLVEVQPKVETLHLGRFAKTTHRSGVQKEKKKINEEAVNELTKVQIRDRQIYGAIRALAELMKVDGEIHPQEVQIFGKFSQDEQKKLSKEYSQESDEFKFVWAKDENLFEALKTYNKTQVNRFFDKLFTMAVIDEEVKGSEIDFLITIYSKITQSDENSSAKVVAKMFKDWKIKNGI